MFQNAATSAGWRRFSRARHRRTRLRGAVPASQCNCPSLPTFHRALQATTSQHFGCNPEGFHFITVLTVLLPCDDVIILFLLENVPLRAVPPAWVTALMLQRTETFSAFTILILFGYSVLSNPSKSQGGCYSTLCKEESLNPHFFCHYQETQSVFLPPVL